MNNKPAGKKSKAPKGQAKRKNGPNVQLPSPKDGYDKQAARWRSEVSAPVARAKVVRNNPPRMVSLRNGDARVCHREYIQDITAASGTPSAFQATSFALNPGNVAVFPWLSQVAKNWESYRFEKLAFKYETEAPSSLGGSLVLSVDYDATDPAPLTKQQAMAYRNATRSAPWTPCEHRSAREDLSKEKTYFVRPGAQPAGTDIKLYDTGNLFVCTQNVTTPSSVCGELYVEYEVELLTPIWENIGGASGTLDAVGLTGMSQTAPFGTNPLVGAGSVQLSIPNPGGLVVSVSGLVVGAEYQLGLGMIGTVITGALNSSASSCMTQKTNKGVGINGAATQCAQNSTWTATATSGTITCTATAATVTSAFMMLTLVPTATA